MSQSSANEDHSCHDCLNSSACIEIGGFLTILSLFGRWIRYYDLDIDRQLSISNSSRGERRFALEI